MEDCLQDNDYINEGDTGVVVWISTRGYVDVCWNKEVYGHDCSGHCENGRGWNVETTGVELISSKGEDEVFEQECESELVALLFGKAV